MTNKTILFISKGEHSASTRYRALNYFPILTANNWTAHHACLHNGIKGNIDILNAAKKSDVVVILRQSLSFPFLQLLRKYSQRLIFDFDDAIFTRSDGTPSTSKAARFDRTIALCDSIWAGNHYLADRALKINANVSIFPTAVDLSGYDGMPAEKDSGFIDLVWIGSSSTGKYLRELLPTLECAAKIIPHLRLKIIADFTLESDILPIHAVPWQSGTEASELKSAHIGIAPMPDSAWTRGKCALKVLQYMASRLPVISSSSGANAEVIKHGASGFLAASPQEWVDNLIILANNSQLQKDMGNMGYGLCLNNYSLKVCSEKMLRQIS